MNSIDIHQRIDKLKTLIREQYAYGYNRQAGLLARRGGGLSHPGRNGLKPVRIKREFPMHRKNKARQFGHFTDRYAATLGHPLVREAFLKGCQDGDRKVFRAAVVLDIQSRVDVATVRR